MSDLVIHALPVAGGILAISPLPGRNGALAEDLEHIREWQPALVISMTTRAEMVDEGVDDLGPSLQERGARWVHLPVADFAVPDQDITTRWAAVSRSALAALNGGGRVLVHCKGGCGRSGMIALRLMVEAGEDPVNALRRLRGVRPCAVETQAQMNWALAV